MKKRIIQALLIVLPSLMLLSCSGQKALTEPTPTPVFSDSELDEYRRKIEDDIGSLAEYVWVSEADGNLSVIISIFGDDYVTYFGDALVECANACTRAGIPREFLTVSLNNSKDELYFIFNFRDDVLGQFIDNRGAKPKSVVIKDYNELVGIFPATTDVFD